MNKKQIAQYQLLNDACLMNQSKTINQIKQCSQGDREICFERAQFLARRGLSLQSLLTVLKSTLKKEQVIRG